MAHAHAKASPARTWRKVNLAAEVRGARILGEAMEGDGNRAKCAGIQVADADGVLTKGSHVDDGTGSEDGASIGRALHDGAAHVAKVAIVCRPGQLHGGEALGRRVEHEHLAILVRYEGHAVAGARGECASVARGMVRGPRLRVWQVDVREDRTRRIVDADGALVVRAKINLACHTAVRSARPLVVSAAGTGDAGEGACSHVEDADVVGGVWCEVDLAIVVRGTAVLVVHTSPSLWQ